MADYILPGLVIAFVAWRVLSSILVRRRLPALLKEGAQVVDVRSVGDFASDHAPGSVNIPLHEIDEVLVADAAEHGASGGTMGWGNTGFNTTGVAADTWHHWAMVVDSTAGVNFRTNVYVDGTRFGTTTNIAANFNTIYVGNMQYGGSLSDGLSANYLTKGRTRFYTFNRRCSFISRRYIYCPNSGLLVMPSKSPPQKKLMAAVAHNPKFAKKVGIPQSVGKDFNEADMKKPAKNRTQAGARTGGPPRTLLVASRNRGRSRNLTMAFIEKRRTGNDAKAQSLTVIGDVQGRSVILVDDEVDTAGSVTGAVNILKDHGAGDMYLCFTHAVLSPPAADRLRVLPIKEIITTNSVPLPPEKRLPNLTVLSVAPLLSEVILRTHEGMSVGQMFNE